MRLVRFSCVKHPVAIIYVSVDVRSSYVVNGQLQNVKRILQFAYKLYEFLNIKTLRILQECSCLLNLLNDLGKRDKMRGLRVTSLINPIIHEARMLDSIHHMTLKFISCLKTFYFCHYVHNAAMDVITFPENLQIHFDA